MRLRFQFGGEIGRDGRQFQARDARRVASRDGAWPSGKARDFGSRIRRFESSRPNQLKGLIASER